MRRSLLNLGVRRSTLNRTSIVDLDSSKWIALLQQPKHLSIMSSFDFTRFISCLVEACGSVYKHLKVILHFLKRLILLLLLHTLLYSMLTALSPYIVDFHILDRHVWLWFLEGCQACPRGRKFPLFLWMCLTGGKGSLLIYFHFYCYRGTQAAWTLIQKKIMTTSGRTLVKLGSCPSEWMILGKGLLMDNVFHRAVVGYTDWFFLYV